MQSLFLGLDLLSWTVIVYPHTLEPCPCLFRIHLTLKCRVSHIAFCLLCGRCRNVSIGHKQGFIDVLEYVRRSLVVKGYVHIPLVLVRSVYIPI